MARYLQTEIGRGITPDGTRVVSAENLEVRWKTRVTSPPEDFPTPMMAHAYAGYGLGWGVGDYLGQPMLSHTGETLGSAAQVAVWPEAGLGVAVLTNGRGADRVAQAVQFRLAELLFGQPAEFDPLVRQAMAGTAEQMAAMRAQRGDRVDPVAVTPFLGLYRNPELGEVALALRDGELIFDAGEFQAELRPHLDEAGNVDAYVAVDPPITGWAMGLRPGAGGSPELVIPNPSTGEEYAFAAVRATPSTPAS
jgi:hypothetical protein